MDNPKNLYEQASYDLNQFRERRVADRRLTPRGTPDRRVSNAAWPPSVQDGETDEKPKH